MDNNQIIKCYKIRNSRQCIIVPAELILNGFNFMFYSMWVYYLFVLLVSFPYDIDSQTKFRRAYAIAMKLMLYAMYTQLHEKLLLMNKPPV